MKKVSIFVIFDIMFVLLSGLSYADLPGQIAIKGPEEITNSVNTEKAQDSSDEICIVGHGADLEKVFNRQKAFVAAFCDALRDIIQIKEGVVTRSNTEKLDKIPFAVIDISSKGLIGSFEVVSNTRTEDETLIEDKIIVKYQNIMVTIINSVLVSPAAEKINFIHWDDFPTNVGGIEVMDVTFNSGLCEVQLSCKK